MRLAAATIAVSDEVKQRADHQRAVCLQSRHAVCRDVLNLLSQVGHLTDVWVLAQAYHLLHQKLMPKGWVLAQNALRHHAHGRLGLLYQTG